MKQWTRQDLEAVLDDKGWLISSRDIEHAIQFELKEGVKVNLYHTGKVVFGGPKNDFRSKVEAIVRGDQGAGQTGEASRSVRTMNSQIPSESERRVFVVYGHDIDAREELELILRRVKANPIILQNIPGKGDTLIERLESLTNVDFACVLLTPDDVGAAKNNPSVLHPRARQNVVLELGMVLSRLGRSRVAILVKGDEIEKPSDIDGLIYISFTERVSEAATELGATLQEAGFSINVRDLLGGA